MTAAVYAARKKLRTSLLAKEIGCQMMFSSESKEKLKDLNGDVHIQAFVTLTCPYCPSAVKLALKLAIESDFIRADMVESAEFPHLTNKYSVFGVPKTLLNDEISLKEPYLRLNILSKL